ncbi:MAG: hypothetical protein WCO05_01795 [Candidatus Moraniibacteriota bacterium]
MYIIHENQLNMAKTCGNNSPHFAIVAMYDDLRAQAVFVSQYAYRIDAF